MDQYVLYAGGNVEIPFFWKALPYYMTLLLCLCMISGCATIGTLTIPNEKLKEKYCDGESKFITVDGMTFHYKDEGTGPVIVLVHGVCASLQTWDGWADELKKNYRVIRMDLPGFGLTNLKNKDVYTRKSALRIMEALDEAFGIDRFTLVGNSLGGYIAWLYTTTHPEKVEKLILIDPAGHPMKLPGLLRFASHPLIRPFSRHMMPRFIFDSAIKGVYGDTSLLTQETKDRYYELACRENGKSEYVDIFTSLKEELKDPNFCQGIDEIKTPTLIMWGTDDTWIPYDIFFKKWQDTLPNAQFISYQGAGHVPMEELPAKTVKDAIRFISDRATSYVNDQKTDGGDSTL